MRVFRRRSVFSSLFIGFLTVHPAVALSLSPSPSLSPSHYFCPSVSPCHLLPFPLTSPPTPSLSPSPSPPPHPILASLRINGCRVLACGQSAAPSGIIPGPGTRPLGRPTPVGPRSQAAGDRPDVESRR